tara:strand:+ start:9127 stop:10047 length:921 start_codon:yes stop_codon:yes gene_type:complete
MKIYINRSPVSGPWGGGNKTVTALADKLEQRGHEVVYELARDLDIIFCFDPRPNSRGEWYQTYVDYKYVFKDTKIIQRVGDLGTHGKPELTELVRETINFSDYAIFPSKWAKEYLGPLSRPHTVIDNAPLKTFFKSRSHSTGVSGKLKIVTHHWSTNPKKGFEYYKFLDKHIVENDNDLAFTYIGRLPDNLRFMKANYHPPTGDNSILADLLSQNHVYLTASEEEAGANHVLEAMASGLPVIYHKNGGSIANYCEDYGIGYDSNDSLIEAVAKVKENFEHYKRNIMGFHRNMEQAIEEYVEIIENV